MGILLQIENLSVEFKKPKDIRVPGITDINLQLKKGETLALVGESGCGKTLASLSIMGLLPEAANVNAGQILFEGEDLLQMTERQRNKVRGPKMGMIFQDPTASLSPYYTIGNQMADSLRFHMGMNRKQAKQYSREWLEKVGIPNPERVLNEYPSQLSGGMRQRVMIAMVLSIEPSLVIADEPTTALDVTTQAEILDLLKRLQAENGMSMIFVSHDLGVVAEMCKRTAVMYAGQVVEEGKTEELFASPNHPYTKALLSATPRLDERQTRFYQIPGQVPANSNWGTSCRFLDRCEFATEQCRQMPKLEIVGENRQVRCWNREDAAEQPVIRYSAAIENDWVQNEVVLSVQGLKTYYPLKKGLMQIGLVRAVDNVSFDLYEGETLALVGESGCGKSTTGRSVLRLVEPTDGVIRFKDKDVRQLSGSELFEFRRQVQMVFQDPSSFLNPRLTVGEAIAEPMEVHHLFDKQQIDKKVIELLEAVGLDAGYKNRYPHECSGGQKQRIGIARALSLNPKVIIADEPVSALDVSIQAQVLNLFQDLKEQFGLSYIFISHDLSVVRHVADRVVVMYLGKIVEVGNPEQLFAAPNHPYTKALLSSIPQPEVATTQERIPLTGEVPSPIDPPSGCAFHTRCPLVIDRCKVEQPPLDEVSPGQWVACHLWKGDGGA